MKERGVPRWTNTVNNIDDTIVSVGLSLVLLKQFIMVSVK